MNGIDRQPPRVEMAADREARTVTASFRRRQLSEAIAHMIDVHFGAIVEGDVLQRMTAMVVDGMAVPASDREQVA